MGLPVWRAPSPEARDSSKADLTAPARSPIRRRSPFTGRRARPTRPSRSPRLHDAETLISTSRYAHPEPLARTVSGRPRLAPPPVPELRNYSRGDPARDGGASGLLAEEDSLTRWRRERHRLYHPSRPTNISETLRASRQLPSFTPNFAPAAFAQGSRERTISRTTSPLPSVSTIHDPTTWHDNFVIIEDVDDDNNNDNMNAVDFPPLRRMGRRTIADGPLPSSSLRESWSPATTTIDGLGDRDRSPSIIDDHWDTMLSTVAPDPLAPTADSSFTSAAASASFSASQPSSRAGSSNSNSASSSRTHLTVPSRRHDSPSVSSPSALACEVSTDGDTASDTEEEDIDFRQALPPVRFHRPSFFTDGPPSRDPHRYSRGIRERSRDASAYVHNFYDFERRAAALFDESEPGEPMDEPINGDEEMQTLDQELRDARAILERLAQREDISDEFWASVGLTRQLADRVERIQQREGN